MSDVPTTNEVRATALTVALRLIERNGTSSFDVNLQRMLSAYKEIMGVVEATDWIGTADNADQTAGGAC